MAPPTDDLFPTLRPLTGTLTPPESAATDATPLTPAVLLDRLGRATTARQRLRDATAAMARAIDEEELLRDLLRHTQRLVPCDGAAFVATIDGTPAPAPTVVAPTGVLAPTAAITRILERAVRTGRPMRDVLTTIDDDDRRATHGLIAVPVRVGMQLLGVLVTWTAGERFPDVEDEDRLTTLGSAAATALAFLRRDAQGERERREIEALVDVARAAGASLRLGETMRLILRHACALTRADGALIALRDGSYLHVRAVHGSVELLAGVHLPVDGSLMGQAMERGTPMICNDCRHEVRAHPAVRDLQLVERAIIAPLTSDAGAIGTLVVINRAQPFDEAEARMLHRLADLVAVAIINARLFEAVEQATREWRSAVDAIATGVFVLDDEHRVVRCNTQALQLCGVSTPRTVIGARFEQLLLGIEDAERREPLVTAAIREGGTVRGLSMARPDGVRFALAASPHPSGGAVVTVDELRG